ncbi:DUF1150 domain-containing protein [Microvirga sp. 17 mud 1-3]|uniref:BQ00720 family protein n=1 Tax=Microvirga sp. 17 mud 1-3 TaxID=2082949 RepID=UPI000D6A9778|nr:DUF1150 domain-containing protein [Microvirga sp. 17 mud 1-3]AWM88026.1 DUF1150 domain-containing protein [Microvirga sp. 17 mud 1-3]
MNTNTKLQNGEFLDKAELAALGEGQMAYVKPILSDEITRLFPQAPEIQPGLKLFALLSASGEPIVLTDTRDAAVANAWAHDLETVSLH